MAKNSSGGNKTTLWFIGGFLVVVAVVVIVAAAMSGTGTGSPNATPSGFVATTVPPITEGDWQEGNTTSSKISVIEYGDFECPACGEYFPIMQQLLANYGSQVDFVFRNFPLYTIHPDAGIAAQAAEAAGLQGQYWPMHDLLYEDQNNWVNDSPSSVVKDYFDSYAQSLGLNVSQFDSDINSSKVTNKIQADVNSGTAAQIDHTPTFFINLTQIPNPTSYNDFASTLDQALAAAGAGTSTSGGTSVTVSSSAPLSVTSTQGL
ncbi:MAG TPA: thioredoxin domain-containing protein [Candidatus Paceibacterota bacterium]|jgi:protein-disulfide isomerase|nr:thioredoxin domain-containing protein [Candidatus Paceibacterota bacterium]